MFFFFQNFEWKNGWTEQKAANACESYFTKSKMFKLCSKITKSSGVDDKTTCVADIKVGIICFEILKVFITHSLTRKVLNNDIYDHNKTNDALSIFIIVNSMLLQ